MMVGRFIMMMGAQLLLKEMPHLRKTTQKVEVGPFIMTALLLLIEMQLSVVTSLMVVKMTFIMLEMGIFSLMAIPH